MKKARIFIVEDNLIVGIEIKITLEKMGFNVLKIASSYEEAYNDILEYEPDIVMMDINLDASKSGIDLAKDINKIKTIPIIYLTAYNDEKTMKKAFETNPLGYIVKPFKREELKSNILLALYKMNKSPFSNENNHFSLGKGYFFDTKDLTLFYKDKPIRLGHKEKLLLDILIKSRGAFVSNEILEHRLWIDNPPSLSSLRTLVYRLKSKIEFDMIDSSYQHGYRLVTSD